MTTFAQDAITLLIDLAQRGEINPWDVQVIEVFDRCLSELASKNQKDLSHSGQVFVYASMLVLLKADSLVRSDAAEDQPSLPEELVDVELDESPLPLRLERYLHRRAVAQSPQKRRVTLNELISQLESMAVTVEGTSRRPYRPRRQSRTQAVRAISQLAHQENLSEVAVELEAYITQRWSQGLHAEDWLDLEALLEFKNDRVGVFLALLFLSAQSKVELYQSEFYQDLKLRPFRPIVSLPNLS